MPPLLLTQVYPQMLAVQAHVRLSSVRVLIFTCMRSNKRVIIRLITFAEPALFCENTYCDSATTVCEPTNNGAVTCNCTGYYTELSSRECYGNRTFTCKKISQYMNKIIQCLFFKIYILIVHQSKQNFLIVHQGNEDFLPKLNKNIFFVSENITSTH